MKQYKVTKKPNGTPEIIGEAAYQKIVENGHLHNFHVEDVTPVPPSDEVKKTIKDRKDN